MSFSQKLAIVTIASVMAAPAFSFGLPETPKLPGASALSGGSSSQSASVDSAAMQDELMRNYISAATNVATAQLGISKALGLDEQAAGYEDQLSYLTSGSVSDADALERNSKKSAKLNEEFNAGLEGVSDISTEAKNEFAKAAGSYLLGVYDVTKMSKSAQDFLMGATSSISSAGMMDKKKLMDKLSTGMYVAKQLPTFIPDLFTTSKSLISFAKSKDIKLPKDAMNASASMF